ncbi:glycosyltransferase [Luedemannella flava]
MDPRIRVSYLVDNVGAVPRPVRKSTLTDAQCQALAAADSRLIPKRWEVAFNKLAEIELEYALRELDTDILVSSSPALMAATTTFARPEVITVHQEHRPSQLRVGTGEPLFQYAPRLDALVVLTERTREWFAESMRELAPRLEIIGNALPGGFRPQSSRTAKIVTIAGRMVKDKQIDHAVQAFATVAEDHPDWILRVIGDGPTMVAVRKLAESLGLNENVQFLGSVQHMPEEWSKSSIALLTSKDGEALPLVLIEAFTAGVPAIAYDCQTGPAEIITHGVNGYVIGGDDVDALSDAIRRLVEDEPLRHAFGAAALKAAEAYDLPTIMGQWTTLYTDLLRDRHSAARLDRQTDRLAAWVAGTGGSGLAPAAPARTGRCSSSRPATSSRRSPRRTTHSSAPRAGSAWSRTRSRPTRPSTATSGWSPTCWTGTTSPTG